MARSVEHIEREIAGLEQTVAAIARQFYQAYQTYLSALGPTVRQQLVLAAYHLCTQGYPDQFLSLSLNQRQDFQQHLLQLAHFTESQLKGLLHQPGSASPLPNSAPDFNPILLPDTDPTPDTANESPLSTAIQPETTDLAESPFPSDEPVAPSPAPPPSDAEFPTALSPKALIHWQEQIEEGISEILQESSHHANRLLQKASILPNKLPDPILEVAAKAGAATETAVGPPNLLNLIVQTEDEDDESSSITHIMAIRLRLAEIEFGDPALTTGRSHLRNLSSKLSQVKRDYQKKQREKTIAAAEAAWRASWYEG